MTKYGRLVNILTAIKKCDIPNKAEIYDHVVEIELLYIDALKLPQYPDIKDNPHWTANEVSILQLEKRVRILEGKITLIVEGK